MPTNQARAFPASYDSTTKIVSAIACAVLLVAVVATKSVIVAAIGAPLIFLSFAYSPRGYRILDRSIGVKRLMGTIQIPIDGLREVRRATPDDCQGCLRLFGNGGLFGYYGLFQTSKLGKCTWYMTNRRNAVVVIAGAKTVLMSPDDVDGFLAAIGPGFVQTALPQSPLPTQPSSLWGTLVPLVIGTAVGVAALAFVISAVTYAPGPPAYTLTSNSLTIHDRFYPVALNAGTVDVEHIRVVDFGTDTGWQPTARTNGFANSHYHSGWFRAANGRKVRMYWADGKRVVLLPPKGDGDPVLLEAKDPVGLMGELRQKWR